MTEPFVISVIDPCDKPVSIIAPTLEAQEYTITDSAKTYKIPVFIPDPAWCDINYSYSVDIPAVNSAVTFYPDASERLFTFEYTASLSLCDLISTEYIVIVSGEVGITEKQTDQASFMLTLKNPCIDSTFVRV